MTCLLFVRDFLLDDEVPDKYILYVCVQRMNEVLNGLTVDYFISYMILKS